ncbi:MAG: hypothetical protein K2X38_06695 [Gemmataceae bacterium]|nr:hypothetical protein [Gemmataceae bacterium]
MEGTVYLLCAATAFACSVLMLRGWLRTRVPLLLAVAVAFAAFAVENAILFADVVLFPEIDLLLFRRSFALLGVSTLVAGLIWGTK